MSSLSLKELEKESRYTEVTDIPEPQVYKSKEDGHCWFLTNKPNKDPEVLSTYVALLDLEDGKSLVYDSRRTRVLNPFLRKNLKKPEIADLKDKKKFNKITIKLPKVYQEIKGGNFLFVDDSGNVLDHYVCLWNVNGEFAWHAKETDFEKVLNAGEVVLNNPIFHLLLGSFGVTISPALAKMLKTAFAAAKKSDYDDLIALAGMEDLKKTKDIFDEIQKLKGKSVKLSDLKKLFTSDEKACKKFEKVEKFFKGDADLDESILPLLQTIYWISE